MLIIPNRAPANLESFPDSIVDCAIRNDDIPSFAKRRDDTGDSRESLRIHDTFLRAQAGSNVCLRLHMNILGAVELRRATRSNSISPESLDRLFFDLLVANEVVEIVGSEIRHGPAVRELDFRASRSAIAINQHTITSPGQESTNPTITGVFSFSCSSNAVCGATSGSGVHSSTKSSISCHAVSPASPLSIHLVTSEEQSHLFCQLNEISIFSAITRAQKVAHEENDKHQLNGAADWVVLVAALDVPDEHGRAGHLLEAARDLIDRADHEFLRVLELHAVDRAVEE